MESKIASDRKKYNEFWLGILLGTLTGILGNFFVYYWTKVGDELGSGMIASSDVIPLFFLIVFSVIILYKIWKRAFPD